MPRPLQPLGGRAIQFATRSRARGASGRTWRVYGQNLAVEPIARRPGDRVWLTWTSAHCSGVPADEKEAEAALAVDPEAVS